MVIDQILEVDTYNKLARTDEGERAVTTVVPDSNRRDWLRFVEGENELRLEEAGAEEVEVSVLWDRRRFE